MYAPLHVHTHYSPDGLSQPKHIAKRIFDIGAKSCAITDHGTICGAPTFIKGLKNSCKNCGNQKEAHAENGKGKCMIEGSKCEKYAKSEIKPILGCEFYICAQDSSIKDKSNYSLNHLCVLSKNLAGWKELMVLTSKSNDKDNFYRKPRLHLDEFRPYTKNGNLVAFSGHPGSEMADICFADAKSAYRARTKEEAKTFLKDQKTLQADLIAAATKFVDIFGKGNFFLEIQLIDACNLPAAGLIASALRWLGKKMGIPCVCTPDAHYAAKDDAPDQRVVVCGLLNTTLEEARQKMDDEEDFGMSSFFRSNRYHIPSFEEMKEVHTEDEMANSLKIAEMCEDYEIFDKPVFPDFPCPDGLTQDQFYDKLCEDGLKRMGKDKDQRYLERIKEEGEVFKPAGLAPYFLVVQDICRYAYDELKCPMNTGRGSAGGCLTSTVIRIMNCDAIKYDLSFERFYNAGRNSPGNISFPDIDLDFPGTKRQQIIDYMRQKYGEDCVAHIATYGRMRGREALKTVFRAHSWGNYEEREKVCSFVPDQAAIADDLQEMQEEVGESSIIWWALENNTKELKEYCYIKEDGTLDGPMAMLFAQAIRMEGTIKSQSTHASGIVISPTPLTNYCPLIRDKKSDHLLVGLEGKDLEKALPKIDILGVAILDKVDDSAKSIRGENLEDDD